jgi:hypothetical protein
VWKLVRIAYIYWPIESTPRIWFGRLWELVRIAYIYWPIESTPRIWFGRLWELVRIAYIYWPIIKINYYDYNNLMKSHDYMFGVYFLNFIIMCIFLFKLANWICRHFCHIDDFTICLWHLNTIQYVKNQMWWKYEPPYLAFTPHVIFVGCDLVAIIYWQPLSNIPITLDV